MEGLSDFVNTDELVIFRALAAFVAAIAVFAAKRTKILNHWSKAPPAGGAFNH